jgi:hypothetical protein
VRRLKIHSLGAEFRSYRRVLRNLLIGAGRQRGARVALLPRRPVANGRNIPMNHWPVAAETLRRIDGELDELTWELKALADGLARGLPSDRRGQLNIILMRAARRRQWIRGVLEEMHQVVPQSYGSLVSGRSRLWPC